MAMCLLTGNQYTKVEDHREYIDKKIEHTELLSLKYLRKVDVEAYAYAVKTDQIFIKNKFLIS